MRQEFKEASEFDFRLKGERFDLNGQVVQKRFNQGKVVVFSPPDSRISFHERTRNEALARKLAEIQQYEFSGEYREGPRNEFSEADHLYFVPHDTIVGITPAWQYRIPE